MTASVVYVGMDVHEDSITIAVAREGREPAETLAAPSIQRRRSTGTSALRWMYGHASKISATSSCHGLLSNNTLTGIAPAGMLNVRSQRCEAGS